MTINPEIFKMFFQVLSSESKALCKPHGLNFREMETTCFLSRETILPSNRRGLSAWRKRLFALMARNAQPANAFFHLPPNRVVGL